MEYYRLEEAAEVLQVGLSTLREWIDVTGLRKTVQQQRLERRPPDVEFSIEVGRGEVPVDGLRSQARHLARGNQFLVGAEQQATKAADVAVANLEAVVQ